MKHSVGAVGEVGYRNDSRHELGPPEWLGLPAAHEATARFEKTLRRLLDLLRVAAVLQWFGDAETLADRPRRRWPLRVGGGALAAYNLAATLAIRRRPSVQSERMAWTDTCAAIAGLGAEALARGDFRRRDGPRPGPDYAVYAAMQSAIQARRPGREASRLVVNLAAIGLTTNLHAPSISHLISDSLTAANGGVSFVAARALRSYAEELDRTRAHVAHLAATRAAHETRRAHHRRIHNSAQQIFEAVARGDELNRDDLLALIEREIAQLDDTAFTRPLYTGLADMLQRLASEFEPRGLAVATTVSDEPLLDLDVLNALSDCVREALQNVWQHARSHTAAVHSERVADQLRITVADTGCGFDPVHTPLGFGLGQLLNTRLLPFGGVARVSSVPDTGTTVTLQVQLSAR